MSVVTRWMGGRRKRGTLGRTPWMSRQDSSRFQPCVYQRGRDVPPSRAVPTLSARPKLLLGRQRDVDVQGLLDRLEPPAQGFEIGRARQVEAQLHLVQRRPGGGGGLQVRGQLK